MSERADLVFFHKARQKVLFSRLSGGQEAVDAPESEAATGSLSRLPLICFGEIAQRPSCLSPSFPDLFRFAAGQNFRAAGVTLQHGGCRGANVDRKRKFV